jgi:hypothetical protein
VFIKKVHQKERNVVFPRNLSERVEVCIIGTRYYESASGNYET